MSPHILTDAMIDQAAAALEVTTEHRQSLAFFLTSAFSFSKSAAGEVALNFLQEGTLYAHIAERGMQFFPQVINDLGIKTNWFLLHETLPALALLRGSTPVCKQCGFLCIGRDERRAWKIFRVREICPNPECHATIEWSPPTTIHFNWVTREWVSLSEHFDKSTDAPLPILLSKIVDFIDRMGGLHPDIIQLLERHAIALPALLAALWVENPVLYHNKQRSVLWAVSKDHYGNQYLFDDRTLLKVANIAKGYVPPVWEGALPPVIKDRGGRPSVQQKPTLKELSVSPVAPAARTVVFIGAEQDRLAAGELKLHLLPLLKANAIRSSDLTLGPHLRKQIEQADLVVCFGSVYLFNDSLHDTPVKRAVDLMEQYGFQKKTVLIRVQNYDRPTEGYFAGMLTIPNQPVSMANDRCAVWKRVVRQISQMFDIDGAKTAPLEGWMIQDNIRLTAFNRLTEMGEEDFLAVVGRIGAPLGVSSRRHTREEPLITWSIAHDKFRELYQAIEYQRTPLSLRASFG